MKIIATSDLHGQIGFDISECDVFIIAGDICPDYAGNRALMVERQRQWIELIFEPWLSRQKAKIKHPVFYLWGNHDWVGEVYPNLIQNSINLDCDHNPKGVEVEDKLFFGDPYVCVPGNRWALDIPLDKLAKRKLLYPQEAVDVLVTHAPPFGLHDVCVDGHVGDQSLASWLKTHARPKLHVYGHIHEGFGVELELDNCGISANVASVDERYEPRAVRYSEFEV